MESECLTAIDEVPGWARRDALRQGLEDGSRLSISHKTRSLECSAIFISIPETEYVRQSASGYTVYIIEIFSGLKKWTVKRRYSDFYYLHSQLKKIIPKKDKPKLPQKRYVGSSSAKHFVEERRKDLESYLQALVLLRTTWNSSDFVRFIDNNENSMMMLWNLEKMRRVQDALSTMTLDTRNETAKLTAELEFARNQVKALQERVCRMEIIFIQQATGAAIEKMDEDALANMARVAAMADGEVSVGRGFQKHRNSNIQAPMHPNNLNSLPRNSASSSTLASGVSASTISYRSCDTGSGLESEAECANENTALVMAAANNDKKRRSLSVPFTEDIVAEFQAPTETSRNSIFGSGYGSGGTVVPSAPISHARKYNSDRNRNILEAQSVEEFVKRAVGCEFVNISSSDESDMSNRESFYSTGSCFSTGTVGTTGTGTAPDSDRKSFRKMHPQHVIEVLDMTVAASQSSSSPEANLNTSVGATKAKSAKRVTRKQFAKVAAAELKKKSKNMEDIQKEALSMQLQEVVELSNEVLEEKFDIVGSAAANVDSKDRVVVSAGEHSLPEDASTDVGLDLNNEVGIEISNNEIDSAVRNRVIDWMLGSINSPFALDGETWVIDMVRFSNEIVHRLLPTPHDILMRKTVFDYLGGLVSSCFAGVEIYAIGSYLSNTFLPSADIDLTLIIPNELSAISCEHGGDAWYVKVNEALCLTSMGKMEAPQARGPPGTNQLLNNTSRIAVNNVSFVSADVKIIRSQINGINVDISANQIGGIYAQAIIEDIDAHVSKNHLFKRSIVLIKAWCINEAPRFSVGAGTICGAREGGLKTWAIVVMIIWIFNRYGNVIDSPVQALGLFLKYFSTFDWTKYAITVFGPVDVESLHSIPTPSETEETCYLPENLLTRYKLRYEYARSCSYNAYIGDDSAIPPAPPGVLDACQPKSTEDDTKTSKPPQHRRISSMWYASGAFHSENGSPHPYQRSIINILDPVEVCNNLSKAVTITVFNAITSAFRNGYAAFVTMCNRSMNEAGSAADMVHEMWTNTIVQLNEHGRNGSKYDFYKQVQYTDDSSVCTNTNDSESGSCHNSTNDSERDSSNTITASYDSLFNEECMKHALAGMQHGEFLLSSIIHPQELMKVIVSYLEKRGCAQPVGELGKMLQSLTGGVTISNRIKSGCGGLKKAIELHGSPRLILSTDHPYNPNVMLSEWAKEKETATNAPATITATGRPGPGTYFGEHQLNGVQNRNISGHSGVVDNSRGPHANRSREYEYIYQSQMPSNYSPQQLQTHMQMMPHVQYPHVMQYYQQANGQRQMGQTGQTPMNHPHTGNDNPSMRLNPNFHPNAASPTVNGQGFKHGHHY